LLLGAHLGWEIPSGKIPVQGGSFDASSVGAGGVAVALDVGVRFARQWYIGATVEHAQLGGGSLSGVSAADVGSVGNATSADANTTMLGVALGLMANPDRASFYGELGIASRWYNFTVNSVKSPTYSAGEITLGAGVWIPAGRSFRFLPKVSVGLGAFGVPNSSSTSGNENPGHAFFMLGLAGYYNANL
jgi:hypothetical protein